MLLVSIPIVKEGYSHTRVYNVSNFYNMMQYNY